MSVLSAALGALFRAEAPTGAGSEVSPGFPVTAVPILRGALPSPYLRGSAVPQSLGRAGGRHCAVSHLVGAEMRLGGTQGSGCPRSLPRPRGSICRSGRVFTFKTPGSALPPRILRLTQFSLVAMENWTRFHFAVLVLLPPGPRAGCGAGGCCHQPGRGTARRGAGSALRMPPSGWKDSSWLPFCGWVSACFCSSVTSVIAPSALS